MDPLLLNLTLLAPLLLGILSSQLLKLPLRGLTGVYVLLAVANVLLWFFLLGDWLTPLLISCAGLLLTVIAVGFLYKRVTPSDFALMMSGIGLFPWLLWGPLAAVAYAVVLALFVVLIALRPKFRNPFKRRY